MHPVFADRENKGVGGDADSCGHGSVRHPSSEPAPVNGADNGAVVLDYGVLPVAADTLAGEGFLPQGFRETETLGHGGNAAGADLGADGAVSFKDQNFFALSGKKGGAGQSSRTAAHDDGMKIFHGRCL